MATRVLIPYDGSKQADRAIDHAIDHFPEATLVALNVINPAESVYIGEEDGMPPFPDDWFETANQQAEFTLEQATEAIEEAGGQAQTAVEVGRPVHVIVDYVEDNDIDHVVMGSHGRSGVTRILLGSVAEGVIRRSPVPVTVVR